MSFAPRVMINQADLPATRLIQPASRLTYRFAVAGKDREGSSFVQWALQEVKRGEMRGVRVESLEGGRPEMRQTLDRAEKFLNLVALLAALLSAVAVALAARGFAAAHLDDCAMLRVLGLSQRTIAMSYAFEFALIGLRSAWSGHRYASIWSSACSGLFDAALLIPACGRAFGWACLTRCSLAAPVLSCAGPPAGVILAIAPQASSAAAFDRRRRATLEAAITTLVAPCVWALPVAVLLFAAELVGKLCSCRSEAPRRAGLLATRHIAARVLLSGQSAAWPGYGAVIWFCCAPPDRQLAPGHAADRPTLRHQLLPDQHQASSSPCATPAWSARLVPLSVPAVAVNCRAVAPTTKSEERPLRLVDRGFNLSHAHSTPHNEVVPGLAGRRRGP